MMPATQRPLERTVTVWKEPGQMYRAVRRQSNKKNNPLLSNKIKSFCELIISENNESGRGLLVTIKHGLLDAQVAAKDLQSVLSEQKYSVHSIDSDDPDIIKLFPEKLLLRRAKQEGLLEKGIKLLSKNSKIGAILLPIVSLLTALLTFFDKMFTASIDVTVFKIILLLVSLVFAILWLGFVIRKYGDQKQAHLNELPGILNTRNTRELDAYFRPIIDQCKLRRFDVNIFRRYDKLLKGTPFCQALNLFLSESAMPKQVNIVFQSATVPEPHSSAANVSTAIVSLDPLTMKEKLALLEEGRVITGYRLECYGVDALIEDMHDIDQHSEREANLINTIEQLNARHEGGASVLYALVYYTSRFDAYLSLDDMTAMWKHTNRKNRQIAIESVHKASVEGMDYYPLLSRIRDDYSHYLVYHENKRSFKFKQEFMEHLLEIDLPNQPAVRDLLIWCLMNLWDRVGMKDDDELLFYIGEVFLELFDESIWSKPEQLKWIIAECFRVFEANESYIYYDEVFDKILDNENLRIHSSVRRFLEKDELVRIACFHSMCFIPSDRSWRHHQTLTRIRATGQKAPVGTPPHSNEMPEYFKTLLAACEGKGEYYNDLTRLQDADALQYYECLYLFYAKSIERLKSVDVFHTMPVQMPSDSELKGSLIKICSNGIVPDGSISEFFDCIRTTQDGSDENSLVIYQLCLVAETRLKYPLLQFLSSIALLASKGEDDEVPILNESRILSLILQGFYWHGRSLFSAKFGELLNLYMEQCPVSSQYKIIMLISYLVYQNTAANREQLIAGVDGAPEILSEIIPAKLAACTPEQVYVMLYHIMILDDYLPRSKILERFKSALSSIGDEEAAEEIRVYLNIAVEGINLPGDSASFILSWAEKNNNLALLAYNKMCEIDEINLLHLGEFNIYIALSGSSLLCRDILVGEYLCKHGSLEDVKDHLMMSRFFDSALKTPRPGVINLTFRVLDKYKSRLRPHEYDRIKSEAITAELWFYNEEQLSRLFIATHPLMALAYSLFLIKHILFEYKAIPVSHSHPLFSKFNEVEAKAYLKNNYTEINAVENNVFNLDFYNAIALVVEDQQLQGAIIETFGRTAVIEHIRDNSISLIKLIIPSIREKQSLVTVLEKSMQVLARV